MDCHKPCPNGRFGWKCQQVCECKNNAPCDNVDGSCACVTPWMGRNCDQLQTSRARDEPVLEVLVAVGSLVMLVAIVMAILFKTGILACSTPGTGEEDKILFELKRMEQDLAQSLQPGWLGRWEKKIRHLTPGPLIGEGMFGQVRRAQLRTPEGERAVAAKTVRVEDSQSYRDFYREAAILVTLHHELDNDRKSNIVRLVGLITKSTEKYILLEYAPKGDLLGFLRGIRNKNEEYLLRNLLGYAVHIARALQQLERLRIAHRDVAARNVLITADDVAKLADFGLARDVYATTQYVRTNQPGVDELLPLKWMALESIEIGEYTCESDVWSFGVLLWEIATLGKDPCYDGRTQLSFLQMVGILRQGIRMKRPPECPEDLYRLMRACWRDVPATRPTPEGIERRLLQLRRLLLPPEAIQMETAL
ncbi:fibroblast growth factor receptor 4-like [Branchiostoma lanceolatum]|uniref:fibroblast growth factor receptor 4-like n=1 Tax=Branchiostoma lanceolatum TaxID=7740 RepID=UPI0034543759